jgi:[ribosomal protein S5]-alanine N-acetyltransferase
MTVWLETERLLMRPLTPGDLDAVHAVFSDPLVMQYLVGGACGLDASRAKLTSYIAHQETHGFSKWAVVERVSGAVIGDCGLKVLEDGPDVELGFHLARQYWGRGYATEAATACLDWGFENLDRNRIVAIVDPRNAASVRVLEKIGMSRHGWATHFGRDWHLYVAPPAAIRPAAPSDNPRTLCR